MLELNKLYCNDSFELIKDVPDKSIDMILEDMPYEVLNKLNNMAKWDIEIDLVKYWESRLRIIKDNGVIVLFGQGTFTAKLMLSGKKIWRYNLIWDKVLKTGFLNAYLMPLRQHEDICIFYKELPTYNPQMKKCEPHKRNHSKGNMKNPQKNSCYGNFVETPTTISDEKFPTSIISINKEHRNGMFFHPTQKPVALFEYLIRTYTNENETIFDGFAGSGTTAIASIKTNRNFICIEKERKYFELAEKRINNELQQYKMAM